MNAALLILVDERNLLPQMLDRTLPELRLCRELRSKIDRNYLRNVIWGEECGVCGRHGASWVFAWVSDGHPQIFLCFRCKNDDYPR
jgi:hypothetical protein